MLTIDPVPRAAATVPNAGRQQPAEMPDLLYILSPSYSGSTLLTFMLAAHPAIATIGELKASAIRNVETYRCSCGELIARCGFWRQVERRMRTQNAVFSFQDFGTHFRRGSKHFKWLVSVEARHPALAPLASLALRALPDYREQLDTTLEQNRRLIRAITSIQGGRVFLDGSKDPERLGQFLKPFAGKFNVVRLLRDGRGIANSYMKHYQAPMDTAAREVVRTDLACDRVLGRVPAANALTIRYEDLCRDPLETLRSIFGLAGIDPEPPARRSSARDFHILGNSMRLEFGKPIALDEKWRKELSTADLAAFERIAGERNRSYGYA